MFCDFTPGNSENLYMEVENVSNLREEVESRLEEYNNMSKKPMKLVIFRSSEFFSWSLPRMFYIHCFKGVTFLFGIFVFLIF